MFKNHFLDIRKSFLLAFPVMLSQLGQVMVGVVDNIMVGRIGTVPLAGASLGNSVFILFLTFGLGISYGITPLVAQADGEANNRKIMEILKHGILIGLVIAILLLIIMLPISYLLDNFNQPPDVVVIASPYLRIIALSIMPFMLFQAFRQFIEGLSLTRQVMVVTIIGNLVNIILNYLLIYGKFGFPAMGLAGAGWATLIARCVMAIVIAGYVISSKRFKKYWHSFHPRILDRMLIRRLLSIGLPSGMQFIFEVGAFSLAAIMIGWFGAVSLAAHQIAINLASITYMMATGIAAATTIRVGNQFGRKDYAMVRKVGLIGFFLSGSMMALNGIILIAGRNIFPNMYLSDPEVIHLASRLILVAAFFQLSDGIQVVGLGALRGMSDVKMPTLYTLVSYWFLALPIGYFLGVFLGTGAVGVWWGLWAGLSSTAVLLYIRFRKITHSGVFHFSGGEKQY